MTHRNWSVKEDICAYVRTIADNHVPPGLSKDVYDLRHKAILPAEDEVCLEVIMTSRGQSPIKTVSLFAFNAPEVHCLQPAQFTLECFLQNASGELVLERIQ